MTSLGTGLSKVDYFSVDFWEKKIFLGGKAYPAGYFAADILNWDKEFNTKLLYLGAPIFHAFADMSEDKLDRTIFDSARDSIIALQECIFKKKPFSLLDLEGEKERTKAYFSNGQFEMLTEYYSTKKWFEEEQSMSEDQRKAIAEVALLAFHEAEQRRRWMLEMLRFYAYVPSDAVNFQTAITNLELEQLHGLKTRDESNFAKACQTFFMDEEVLMALSALQPSQQMDGFNPKPVVQSLHVVSEHPTKKGKLTFIRRMYFSRLMDFLVTDFFNGLHLGHSPKACDNCGRYFLMTDGRHQRYCNGIDPKDLKKRSCRKVCADKNRKERENSADHPIKRLCVARLSTINKHKSEGKITPKFADVAKRIAQDCRDRALDDLKYANTQYENDMTQEAIYAATNKKLGLE